MKYQKYTTFPLENRQYHTLSPNNLHYPLTEPINLIRLVVRYHPPTHKTHPIIPHPLR